ncbi:hypothetical protein [Oryzobacter terrae]|uniref:hypothetical protein n=1 Tax=Oryzobacter terrae TaxID=1620385 RepID=UPI00366BAC33
MAARRPRTSVLSTGLAAAALAAGSVLTAAPAQAGTPTHTVETRDFVATQHLLDTCGFPVSLHVRGTFNVVSFTDDEGTLTKEIRNYRFRGTLTANGVTLEGVSRGPEIWTYAPDGSATVAIHGVVNRRVPGQGTVTLHAGYALVAVDGDVEVRLVDPTGQEEDAAQLCSLFTP